MAKSDQPTTIKKYANRRLYNTGTSTYVTLEDLASMVKDGEDFLVYDAKTGDDITRSVLAQIIFEQENKAGQNLLPTTFLRQLIRFYGDSMQMVVPKYLQQAIASLTQEQEITVFRIVQESLQNIQKHARASHVAIALAVDDEALRATIRDDGRGFVVQQTEVTTLSGVGLRGMGERAAAIGGEVQVESRPGEGSTVRLVLPRGGPAAGEAPA